MTRYTVEGSEGEFESGSNGQVLKNKLGITDAAEIQEAETELLLDLYTYVLDSVEPEQRLTVAMVAEWHRKWLGNLYDWAGQERSVNLSKGGFPFAAAAQIPSLLKEFDRCLARLTPCSGMDRDNAIAAIAEVHVEFILIHPFREGNGRIARLLADVMAGQAGLGQLDYTPWEQDKEAYIAAIHTGLDRDYGLMTEWVRRALGS
jgi:cell filamentation protein